MVHPTPKPPARRLYRSLARGGSGRLSPELYMWEGGGYIGVAAGLARSPSPGGTWDVVPGHWLGAGGIGNGPVEPQKLGHRGV